MKQSAQFPVRILLFKEGCSPKRLIFISLERMQGIRMLFRLGASEIALPCSYHCHGNS